MKRIFLMLLFALASSASAVATEIFFPAEVAGGRVSIWSSGALVFTDNGWGHFESGESDLRLKWEDKKDDLRMFMRVWHVDLPDGRLVLGAERIEEQIVFTLTREGDKRAFLRSEPFEIETWKRAPADTRSEANQRVDPTSVSAPRSSEGSSED